MKRISFLKDIALMLGIAIIVGFLMHYIAPIFSFWQYFIAVVIVYVYKKLKDDSRTTKLAKACLWVIIIYAIYLFLYAAFPMSVRMTKWGQHNVDFFTSEQIADSINSKRKLIFEGVKDTKLEAALKVYKQKLIDNDPQGAERYMDSLEQIWTKSGKKPSDNLDEGNSTATPSPPANVDPKLIERGKVYVLEAGQIASSRDIFPAGERVYFDVISGSVNQIDLDHRKVFIGSGYHYADIITSGPIFFEGVSARSEILIK